MLILKIAVLGDVTPCSRVNEYRSFKRTCFSSNRSKTVPRNVGTCPQFYMAHIQNAALRAIKNKKGKSLSTTQKHIQGVEAQIHLFLISALSGCERWVSRLGDFTPGKEPQRPLTKRMGEPQILCEHYGEESEMLIIRKENCSWRGTVISTCYKNALYFCSKISYLLADRNFIF